VILFWGWVAFSVVLVGGSSAWAVVETRRARAEAAPDIEVVR
jgi:hypothetical protein